MKPEEFDGLAKALAAWTGCSTQPRDRTVVGRAYYASFLATRDRLRQLPELQAPLNKRLGIHENVRKCLSTDRGDLRVLAHLLKDLETLRGTADYEMNTAVTSTDASEALRICAEILTRLGKADLTLAVHPITRDPISAATP